MTFLDLIGLFRDYSTKRRLLVEKINRVLNSCGKREECLARIFKILSDFLEKDPEENVRIARSIVNTLPAEYADSVAKFIEAFCEDATSAGSSKNESDIEKIMTGDISCSDLESLTYIANESRDFVAIALTLAILERAGWMKECGVELGRSLLALIRRLYESGNKELLMPILNKYGVKIYVHKSGEEIRGVKVVVGNSLVADLTSVLSTIYPYINTIMYLGDTHS